MKFEEAFGSMRKGNKIRRKSYTNLNFYYYIEDNKHTHIEPIDIYPITEDDLLAEDWEIYIRKEII